MCGSSRPTVTLWFDPSHRPRAGPQSSTSCLRCSRCVRRLVMSRLRQSPASPSGPVQHACFLRVSVPLTGRAVLWRLTIRRVLDHNERQSEDVNTHLSRSHRSDSTYAPEQAPRYIGQQWRRYSTLGGSLLRCMELSMFHISCFQPLLDEFPARNRVNGLDEILVRDVIECPSDVGIEHPLLGLVRSGQSVDFFNGVMATSPWSESVATTLKSGFPGWFKGVLHHRLKTAIHHDGDSEWP
jgi:hypothetical protein